MEPRLNPWYFLNTTVAVPELVRSRRSHSIVPR